MKSIFTGALFFLLIAQANAAGVAPTLKISDGGTGSSTAASARTNLGAAAADGSTAFTATGNSATGAASDSVRFGHIPNMVDEYSAVGNGQRESFLTTCAASSASITFAQNSTWAAPAFSSADIGKKISIPGCGGNYVAPGPIVISTVGTGQAIGDLLTLNAAAGGGVCSVNPQVRIDALVPGTTGTFAAHVSNIGACTVAPSGALPQLSSTGSGTGASFTLQWSHDLLTTITAVNSPASITVADLAGASQSTVAQFVLWGTPDGQAFQNALNGVTANSAANGGRIYVPATPKGFCYLIDQELTYPAPASATPPPAAVPYLVGAGPASRLCAFGYLPHIIATSGTYNRGGGIEWMELDGNNEAGILVDVENAGEFTIDHTWVANWKTAAVRTAIGGQNHIRHVWLDNHPTYIPNAANRPPFGIMNLAPDDTIIDAMLYNTSHCGVLDLAADLHLTDNHPYGPTAGGYASDYPYCLLGSGTSASDNTGDYANIAGMYLGGYGVTVQGGYLDNAPVGIEIASGALVVVHGVNMDANTPIPIQQDGTANPQSDVGGNTGVAPVYSRHLGVYNGSPSVAPETTIGMWWGDFSQAYGLRSYGHGNGILGADREGCSWWADKPLGWIGDDQAGICFFGAIGVGSVKILAGGATTPNTTNIMRVYTDKPRLLDLRVTVQAFCSSEDYAVWTIDHLGLVNDGTVAGTKFTSSTVGGASTTTPPALTMIKSTAAGASWTAALVLDTTDGGAYLTGNSTCAGGKSTIWQATARINETTSGSH